MTYYPIIRFGYFHLSFPIGTFVFKFNILSIFHSRFLTFV